MNAADFESALPGDFDKMAMSMGPTSCTGSETLGPTMATRIWPTGRIYYFGTTPVTAAVNFEPVPEPAMLALLASGALMLLAGGYRSCRIMM